MIHIRLIHTPTSNHIHQYATILTGIDPYLDLSNIYTQLKSDLQCEGILSFSLNNDFFIKLYGDQRLYIRDWLFKHHIVNPSDGMVTIHGY